MISSMTSGVKPQYEVFLCVVGYRFLCCPGLCSSGRSSLQLPSYASPERGQDYLS
ncbi:hypothetical protein SERLADRAFT_383448, partial [Serpula lacrymans var. lacrymans S7.9]